VNDIEDNDVPRRRRQPALLDPAYLLAVAVTIGTPIGVMTPDLPVRWQTPVLTGAPLLALIVAERCQPRAIRRLEQQLFFDDWDIAAPPTP
jgi:hypothetical protein